jgi:hypothetical protein
MITFTDKVKQYVIDNARDFDNETYEAVLEIYPDPVDFQAAMDRDSATHVNAVARAGVPADAPDAISRVFLDFQLGDITPQIAAAELGVTTDELLRDLDNLDPILSPLENGGHVDRQQFTSVYLDSLCEMQAVSENQPVGCP